MPQVLSELPKVLRAGGGTGGREEKHPYDEWFTGEPLLLVPGEDFDCAVKSIRSSIGGAARKRGIKVKTVETPEGVAVQAVGTREAKAPTEEPIAA